MRLCLCTLLFAHKIISFLLHTKKKIKRRQSCNIAKRKAQAPTPPTHQARQRRIEIDSTNNRARQPFGNWKAQQKKEQQPNRFSLYSHILIHYINPLTYVIYIVSPFVYTDIMTNVSTKYTMRSRMQFLFLLINVHLQLNRNTS